jgi:RNA polymerase sigma-70 factor (ECF subfamily)
LDRPEAKQRFNDLIWPHLPAVLRLAHILTGNDADAEDLAQETLMKAFRSIDTLRDEAGTKSWLMRILRNTRVDRFRSEASRPTAVNLEDLAAETAAPEFVADSDGNHADVQGILDSFSDAQVIECLGQLPEEIRWTLLLVDVEQLGQVEAAEILQVPVGTVKSRVHRGRAMLRQSMLPVARKLGLVKDRETEISEL